jgi:hypothetical protein
MLLVTEISEGDVANAIGCEIKHYKREHSPQVKTIGLK